MMGVWDLNFVQRPDSVTGLQRRVGSYINEFKAALQERVEKEHEWELADAIPQVNHGTHKAGSAKVYVTELDEEDPTERPTGGSQTALILDDDDRGRLLIKEERNLYFWKDFDTKWKKLELTEVGMINLWPGATIPENWFICNGQVLQREDYPALFAVVGTIYGSESSTDFRLPDLQGLIPMGQGTQEIDSRVKGYSDPIGTIKEDRIQTFGGTVQFRQMYKHTSIVRRVDGIFEIDDNSSESDNKRIDDTSKDYPTKGFKINLSAPDEPVRNGPFSHPSTILMHYIIKAT